MINGQGIILKYIFKIPFQNILNIGSGDISSAEILLKHDKIVTDIDLNKRNDLNDLNYSFIEDDFIFHKFNEKFDAILANHILEHILDTKVFLTKCASLLNENGYFFVIVPPLKQNIVGGHVHIFNMGLLMYNLALCGFDVKNGHFKKEKYNIMGIVKVNKISLPKLKHDIGDIEILVKNKILPDFFTQSVDGDFNEYNWEIK